MRRIDCCLKFQEEALRESPAKISKLLANHCLKGSVTMQKQLVCGVFSPIAVDEGFNCLPYCIVLLLKRRIFLLSPIFQLHLSDCVLPFI